MLMGGQIYIVRNDVNDYVYIGLTKQPVTERFRQHIYAANHMKLKSKFYNAIREIGSAHFSVDVLEHCRDEELSEREKYYIKIYDSFHAGYNSTPGGENRESLIDESEFIDDCYNLSLIDVGVKYGIKIQTVIKKMSVLGVSNRLRMSGYGTSKIPVIAYDKQFNPLHRFESISEAIRSLHKSDYGYAYISQACKQGNIAYGYRWQQERELIGQYQGIQIVYNTIFDRYEHEVLLKPIMKVGDFYRSQTIYYPDYVGDSACYSCKICGAKLSRDGTCEKCKHLESQVESKNYRDALVNTVRDLAISGMSYQDMGRYLGMTPNGVKKICLKNNIDVSSRHINKTVKAVSPQGETIIINEDEAVEYLINQGRASGRRQTVKANIRRFLNSKRLRYGYYWQDV